MSERKITEAQFSMQCSYIAKNAAAWAGDLLTLPENLAREADPDTVGRFTDEMRGRLDRLDQWAGRTPPPAQTQPVEAQGDPIGYVTGSNMRGLIDGVQGVMTVSNVQNALFQNPIFAAPQPAAAVGEVERLREALEPFSKIAGEMFARNWNAKQIVAALDTPDHSYRVRAGDFFKARAALHGSEKGEA